MLESDLIFEDSVLEELVNDPRETLALVDKYESWMDGTCLKITSDDRIEKFISGKIDDKFSAKELCKNLLIGYNIFLKDLSPKVSGKNYLRLAVRLTEDNDKLLESLKKELSA